VPHYLPGENKWINEMTQNRGIPLEAALGGPATMYPEYRKVLKDTYKMPAACKVDCGTPPAAPAGGRGAPPPHPCSGRTRRARAARHARTRMRRATAAGQAKTTECGGTQ
jgi:hypothetical protein